MLRTERRLYVPTIGALHRTLELRTPHVRLSWHHGQRVASDWALIEQASPFLHRKSRTAVSFVLEGAGRFEEGGAREWLTEGSVVATADERRLSFAIDEQLSNLQANPAVEDVADEVGWSSRHARRAPYRLPFAERPVPCVREGRPPEPGHPHPRRSARRARRVDIVLRSRETRRGVT